MPAQTYIGTPCKKCGSCERRVSNKKCEPCRVEGDRRYYEKNRDKVLEDKRRYYEKNLDKHLEYGRHYHEENRDNPQYHIRRRENKWRYRGILVQGEPLKWD